MCGGTCTLKKAVAQIKNKMIILLFTIISSVENLTKECLGYAEDVYEHVLVH